MKYTVHFSALVLAFASMMLAQPSPKASVAGTPVVSRVIDFRGPVPACEPSHPSCGIDSLR